MSNVLPRPARRFAGVRRLALALPALAAVLAAACSPSERALAPEATPRRVAGPTSSSGVVISQVYGGGGNTGATLRNDFIELYNAADTAVTLAGWSVQYASSAGTSWAVTTLSGSIQPGRYYLIQQAAGTGGSQNLPTPDAVGTIAMSGTSAKVALVRTTTPLTGACPTAEDFVGYGTAANCFEGTAPTATLSNTTAALRKDDGRQDTDNNANDFVVGTPNPRNSQFGNTGISVTVVPNPAQIVIGGTTTLTATVTRNNAPVTPTSVTWASNPDGRIVFTNQSGLTVTGTGATAGTAQVTVTVIVDGQPYTGSTTVTVVQAQGSITVEGYSFRGSDPLPVGFQETYRARDPQSGNTLIRRRLVWTTSNSAIATVDSLGNVTGVAPGTVNVIATDPETGRSGLIPLTVGIATWSDTVGVYANPLQFGTPSGPTVTLVRRQTYAAGWSDFHGQPRWVTYNLDASHRTGQAPDRCDCFTPDPLLGPGNKEVTTADYDGTGFSRGHMTMSADRTRGELDNATTFYFSNIIPQTNQNNGGPWLGFEQFLGNLATQQNREIYIVAGGARYSGWLQSANPLLAGRERVAIPTWTWKVAVVMERGKGIADVRSASDVRVYAVAMPNTTDIPQTPATWVNYQASVDSIEALTGYDVLSLLPAPIQALVEAQTPQTRAVAMEVGPEALSLSRTRGVSVSLLSGVDFDATTFDVTQLRLVTESGQQVPVLGTGTLRDVNDDGKLDLVVGFSSIALSEAGLAPGTPRLQLRLAGTGTPAWLAVDVTPPSVTP
jgi:DNA/RNA endonuclease G (NUC1)